MGGFSDSIYYFGGGGVRMNGLSLYIVGKGVYVYHSLVLEDIAELLSFIYTYIYTDIHAYVCVYI